MIFNLPNPIIFVSFCLLCTTIFVYWTTYLHDSRNDWYEYNLIQHDDPRLIKEGIVIDGGTGKLDNEIIPGKQWVDVDGKVIQAHGGCIILHDGVYYWYGEIKQGKTVKFEAHMPAHIDFVGIACYSSTDLVNWFFEGRVLESSENSSSPMYKLNVFERPKVLYNDKMKYFVLWFHFDEYTYFKAQVGVATADTPTGPFKFLKSFNPHEKDSRDMTVFKDSSGQAYLFYSSYWNINLYVTPLTGDYLDVQEQNEMIIEGLSREAPAVFKHGTRYLMLTSGCTGWQPNEARVFVADHIFGPWKDIGTPCMGTPEQCATNFNSQDAYVFALDERRGLYVMVADRWVGSDLEQSTYVWLPLFVFDERMMNPDKGQDRVSPVMLWLQRWRLDQVGIIQQRLLIGDMTIQEEFELNQDHE